MKKILRLFASGLRNGFVAIGALAFLGGVIAFADYSATQGSGTTFASKVISAVHYTAQLLCDATAGESQCAAVDSGGNLQTGTPDGKNVALGAVADAAWSGTGNATVVAALKAIYGAATGSVPAGSALIGGTTVYYGSAASVDHPCQTVTKTRATFTITSATSTKIISGTSAKKTYICAVDLYAFGAQTVGVVEGTKVTNECDTGASGIIGDGTAAHGIPLPANGNGVVRGNGASTVWSATNANADDVCLVTSTTAVTTGQVQYVQK